jgi:hypothetical protein
VKLLLKELTLRPAGTDAAGAALDDGADDDGAEDEGDVVVAVLLFELLLQAASRPTSPNTAMPASTPCGRRWA